MEPSLPPSKSFPLPFHICTATLSCDRVIHNSFIYYKVNIGGIGNSSWDVYRRFSDFQLLYEKIHIKVNKKFPPRYWFSFLIALTEDEENMRQRDLSTWFSSIMAIAVGETRPNGASTFEINKLKECLNDFLDMKENFATALKNTEQEDDNHTI